MAPDLALGRQGTSVCASFVLRDSGAQSGGKGWRKGCVRARHPLGTPSLSG